MVRRYIVNDIITISHMAVDKPQNESYFSHMHYTNEILYFIRGDAEYTINGYRYLLQPYDFLIIPKGVYHCLNLRSDAKYENYVINFDDRLVDDDSILERLFLPPLVFNTRGDKRMAGFFESIEYCSDTYSKQDFEKACISILKEMLMYCCYAPRTSTPTIELNNSLVKNAISYITENISSELNAGCIAKELNVSASHLQNVFSQQMKIGLKQYITQRKIISAHDDLLTGASAMDTATKYGFDEYSTFYRQYIRTFGTSPSSNKIKQQQ